MRVISYEYKIKCDKIQMWLLKILVDYYHRFLLFKYFSDEFKKIQRRVVLDFTFHKTCSLKRFFSILSPL